MEKNQLAGRQRVSQSPTSGARRAFTLVELLVVIAIIGILVALLLPAIQAAREAARRSDCVNRIRQLVLAAHNYYDANSKLPTHGDVYLKDNRIAGGLSSQARLLPYMEDQALLNLVAQDFHWRDPQNATALRSPLPFLRCPSGQQIELTLMGFNPDPPPEENNLRCHYVGIMGARPGPTLHADGSVTVDPACRPPGSTGRGGGGGTLEWPQTTYFQHACSASPSSGGTAINGVIYPLSKVSFAKITDGTTKTLMYGEMSWGVGPQAPWLVGSTSRDGTSPALLISSSNGVVFNAKTVRYGINEKKRTEPDGVDDPTKANDLRYYVPLTEESLGSNHPGGAHVAMCDGSARFVGDDLDVDVLRRMASRNSEDIYDAAAL